MDKQSKKEITSRIKFFRNKNGLTQEEMAEKTGLEYGSYVQMENGANLPSLNVLIKLSQTFNISIDAIIFGNDNKSMVDSDESSKISHLLKFCDIDKLKHTRNILNQLIELLVNEK